MAQHQAGEGKMRKIRMLDIVPAGGARQIGTAMAGPVMFAMLLLVLNAAAMPVVAETAGSRSKLFQSQTGVLDQRAAIQYRSSVRLQPKTFVTPTKWGVPESASDEILPVYRGRYQGPYVDIARNAARKHGVPEDLFLRLVNQESRFNDKALSHKGAIGLAQLMPATARYLGVNPKDPVQNLEGGAKYLREQFNEFGSWRLALAAYNAGPNAVKKYGGVPPYRETKNYVIKILGS